jgi:hypothetical protein
MHGVEHPNCFQFNEQPVLDHQIDGIFAGDHAVIMHGNVMLLRHDKADFAQFMCQGIFVNLLQKAAPKGILNDEGPTNDGVAQAVDVVICVHPWFH